MVQIFINDVEYTRYVRQDSIQISDQLSDPVPTLQFDLEDPAQVFRFLPYQQVVVLEDTQPASPTHNIYIDPMYTTQTNVSLDTAHETISYNTTAGSATFVVTTHSTPTATLSQTQTVRANPSQTYTFSIYRNISSIANCTVFITTAVINADGSTASTATDTFTTTSGGTVRYSKTVSLSASTRFISVTYGVQSIISTSACNAVFSHAQIEMQRTGQGISYPTPDCVSGATNCTQLPNLTTVRETRLWAGYLLIPTVTYQAERLWTLHCSGIACLLSKRAVASYSYNGQTDSAAVLALASSTLSGVVTASSTTVIGTGYTFDLLGGQNTYAKDILDTISKQTGAPYWVDAYGILHYQVAGLTQASFSLSDTPDSVTSFPYYAYSYEVDATAMFNNILVMGAAKTVTLTANATGTGSQSVFPIGAMDTITSVTINGSSTSAYQWVPNYIIFNAPPANGAAIVVNGSYTYVDGANITDGISVATYGITLQSQIQDTTNAFITEVIQHGIFELEGHGPPQTIVKLSTQQFLASGQTVSFTSAADGIHAVQLLVQQVQSTILGTNELGVQVREYQVTLGDYRADFIHQLLVVQRQVANQSTSSTPATFQLTSVAIGEETVAFSTSVTAAVTTTPNLQGADTFTNRNVAGSFGTASDGQSWSVSSSSGSPAVSVGAAFSWTETNVGQVFASASTSFYEAFLGTNTVQNTSHFMRVAVCPKTSSGHSATFTMLARAVDANNRYFVSLTATDGSSSATLALKKTIGGVTSTISSTTISYTPSQSLPVFWWLRCAFVGSALSVKAWADGASEPASPQLSVTDSGVSGAGRFGLSCSLPNDSASFVQFDTYSVLGV